MPADNTTRSSRPAWRATAALLLSVVTLACGCAPSPRKPSLVSPSSTPSTPPTTFHVLDLTAFKDRVGAAPLRSTVARGVGRQIEIYSAPGDTSARRTLSNPMPGGANVIFLVAQQREGWLKVFLPVRPNGSTGWVRAKQVRLSQHDFHIVVGLKAHTITVYNGGKVIDREPVGIGTRQTPTPGGLYYTIQAIRPPTPNSVYGTYAYVLSGFSEVLKSFNGGEPFLGIHGTNDPSGLGKDVSHGCIRMSNAGINKLAKVLPLGVPVIVVP